MDQNSQSQEQQPAANVLENPIALLSRAFTLYWEKLGVLLPVSFIVFIVGVIQVFYSQTNSVILTIVSSVAGIIVAYVAYVVMIKIVSSPTAIHIGQAVMSTEHIIASATIVSSLMILAVLGGTLLLVVPGVIVGLYISFSLFAVITDRYEKREALIFSWHLVKDRWWSVFLRFFVANIAMSLVIGLVMAIFWQLGIGETPFQTLLRMQQDQQAAISVSQLILNQAVDNFFTVPIMLCFVFVFYEALKRTAGRPLEEKEKADINWYIQTLSIIGIVLLIVTIFVSGFFVAKYLPSFVRVTHMPAAAFSIF